MTQKQFAALGGEARAKKLSRARRIEIARNAGLASAKGRRLASKHELSQLTSNGEKKSK